MNLNIYLGQLPSNLSQFGFDMDMRGNMPLSREKVERVALYVNKNFRLLKCDTLNKKHSSYLLKHIVEFFMEEYVANGELIAAMIMLGYNYKVAAPNAYFYLHKSPVNRLVRTIINNEVHEKYWQEAFGKTVNLKR